MIEWLGKKCQTGSSAIKVSHEEALNILEGFPGWVLDESLTKINKRFEFKNFKQTMFFMNAVAFLCEAEVHHPDVKLGFNYCEITFTTHDMHGLSENDFICAAKVNHLLM